jgi:hypothetical protein
MSNDRLERARSALCVTDLPPDQGNDRWSKHFDCPFCGHDKSAGINYALCWFKCFACNGGAGRNESWGTWREYPMGPDAPVTVYAGVHLVSRYRLQIERAARSAKAAFKWCVDLDDARSYARWRMLVFAGIAKPDTVEYGKGDWNKLPGWEAKANGDDNKLDSYVGQALKRDLGDYGKRKLAKARREQSRPNNVGYAYNTGAPVPAMENLQRKSIPGPEAGLDWIAWPTLALSIRDQYTDDEIAAMLGKSLSTVRRTIAAELQAARADRGLAVRR